MESHRASQSPGNPGRATFPLGSAADFCHRHRQPDHLLQSRIRRHQWLQRGRADRQPAQSGAPPGHARSGVRVDVALPESRQELDGHRQEPLPQWRLLLGQCLRHADPGRWPGDRLRVGTGLPDPRAGAPCRGPVCTLAPGPVGAAEGAPPGPAGPGLGLATAGWVVGGWRQSALVRLARPCGNLGVVRGLWAVDAQRPGPPVAAGHTGRRRHLRRPDRRPDLQRLAGCGRATRADFDRGRGAPENRVDPPQ
ncbi:hypothetical protein D3C81_1221080 [compost metagenome]